MMRFLIRAGAVWGACKIISKLVAGRHKGDFKTEPIADHPEPPNPEAEPHISSVAIGEIYEEAAKKLTKYETEGNEAGHKRANA